jgi:ribosomal protein L2
MPTDRFEDGKTEWSFFVDDKEFKVGVPSTYGAQILSLVDKDSHYDVFLEMPGIEQDRQIGVNESVDLRVDRVLRFQCIPQGYGMGAEVELS